MRPHLRGVALVCLGATTLAAGLGLLVAPSLALIAAGLTIAALGTIIDWE